MSPSYALMKDQRVSSSSKGYALLKKAGWVEGTGLGAQKQGRTTPVPAWLNDGRRGIGCPPKKTLPSPPLPSTPKATASEKKTKKRRKTKGEKNCQRMDRDGVQYRAIRRKLEAVETLSAGVDSNPLLRSHGLSSSNPLLP